MAASKSVQHGGRTVVALRKDPRFTLVESAEKFIPFPAPGHRTDLFGIIDILAIGPGITLAVQATSVGALSAHKKKLREHPNTPKVLEAGWLLEIWAWQKIGHRWSVRIIPVKLETQAEGDA